MRPSSFVPLALAALAPVAAACGDSPAGPGDGQSAVTLSVVAGAPAAPTLSMSSPASFDLVYNDGTNDLTITSIQLVMREIELELQNDDACDDHVSGVEDSCEEFETGPQLVAIPVDGSVASVDVAGVAPGTYDEIQFKVHKPESDPGDDAFLLAHPEFAGISVRVTGSYNGSDFEFVSDLSNEIEQELSDPLVVDGTGTANLTLALDVESWFRDPATGDFIDPATASTGQPNESLVEENIKNSFEAFEDHDHDGEPDDGSSS